MRYAPDHRLDQFYCGLDPLRRIPLCRRKGNALALQFIGGKIDGNDGNPVDANFRTNKGATLGVEFDIDAGATGAHFRATLGLGALDHQGIVAQVGYNIAGRRAIEAQRAGKFGAAHATAAEQHVEGPQFIEVADGLRGRHDLLPVQVMMLY
jgi:hypothetical protein